MSAHWWLLMRVLVACEYSGVVRNAFLKRGHMAFSCDILSSESICYPYHHFQDDVLNLLKMKWDLIIAHPPCTHLSISGARFWKEKSKDGRQQAAIDLFMRITNAHCDRIAIENPVGIISTVYKKPT